MLTLGLIVIGVVSFTRMPQELFPPINFPQITIVTEYPNAAPEEIETLITRPIEESVGSVAGLKRIESVSREGRSTVKVAFNWGQDVDFAALAVREKIDTIKERLPKEAGDPVVLKYDPLARPILILSVTGPNLEPIQLKQLTEKMIKDNLEKVEGVASAALSGGASRMIYVNIDQGRLQANHLSLLEVIDSIEKTNVSYPAGSIKKGLYEYLIRTVGEFRSVKEIGYAVAGVDNVQKVKREDTSFLEKGNRGPRDTLDALREEVGRRMLEKRLVLVRDIADVVDGAAEKTSISRHNGYSNIAIQIQKQASANTIQVVNNVRQALAILNEDITTRGIHYDIIYDHSVFIRRSLEDLTNDAKTGGVLALIVLVSFLRVFSAAFAVTMAIPLTMMGTFFLLSLSGITLNTMSLGGLALGAGMIVDTSIVVLENIFRRRQLGEDPVEAAVAGTDEMVLPVITSNATTIAVFLPLIVFVPGIPGQLFKDLSWAIIHSQIISTILPLTVLPLFSIYMKVKTGTYKPFAWNRFLEKNLVGERISVKAKMAFAAFVLLVAFGVSGTSFLIFPTLEREVLPKVDQGQFIVKVDMPLGTRLEVTDRVCQRFEEIMRGIPEVEGVAVTIGSEKGGKGQVQIDTLRPSQALILVSLKKSRKKTSADIVTALAKDSKEVDLEGGNVDFILQESEFAFAEGGSKPILIELKGYDFTHMAQLMERVKTELAKIPGVINIQDDMSKTSPETKLHIDRRRAALYGISALDISLITKAALGGVVATQYREAGKEFDILVRLSEKDRNDLDNLNELLLYSRVLDSLIQLKEVAAVDQSSGPSEIKRLDQDRTIVVSADTDDKAFKSKDILPKVQAMLKGLNIKPESGMQAALSGKAKEVKENFGKVMFAFMLAILLVYMILAAQFESFMQPLIIMLTVPLAFSGILVALFITGTSVNVISALGTIILVGTAVANGIILIETINQMRTDGMDVEEAAMDAAKTRTRPIMMSLLTSLMGMLPLALGLGEGAELRSPMAISMMGGQISSTFLTLIVVPCFYILMTRCSEVLWGVEEEVGEKEEEMEADGGTAVPPEEGPR